MKKGWIFELGFKTLLSSSLNVTDIKFMSSKTKKSKKKTKTLNDVTKSKDSLTNKKIHTYFSNDEIVEMKSVLKIKDVTGVPFIIAATFLYKFDLLKELVKDGYNVNQTGQNNMTALMWAVKCKYLDMVEYLLSIGADPTIKTDSGDNVLILALEHKLWDEQSTISLWKTVKRVSFVDVNFTNKNGHNMLHMCVRRDWEELLKLFLHDKPNIDAGNSNGVTPLMLACFRNNINIINILINNGANTLKEDNHGRMTLCYAITSITKPPFVATERIISELRKKSLMDTYLKRRVELVVTTALKNEISCATADMLIKIVQFSVQHIEEAVGVFLECNVFAQLLQILETQLGNTSIVKFLLEVCTEILHYNEQSVGYKPEMSNRVLDSFYKTGFANVVLEIMRNQTEEGKIAFNVLVLAFTNDSHWEKLLEENCNVILAFLNDGQDENQGRLLKNKKRRLKKIFESLEIVPFPRSDSSEKIEAKKSDCVKKARRRSKTIKAKLSKIKSAELTKRLSFSGKKTLKMNKSETFDQIQVLFKAKDFRVENPIAASFQHLLTWEEDNFEETSDREVYPIWKKQIKKLSRLEVSKNLVIDEEKLAQSISHLQGRHKFDSNISRSVNVVVDYLRQLGQMIIRKYQEHWENDRMTGDCNCVDIDEHVPWLISHHLEKIEVREKDVLQNLQKNFDELLKAIKDLAHKDPNQCLKSIKKLESTILNYDIRGIKLMSYVCGMENFTMKYTTTNPMVDDKSVINYVQNVVNDEEDPRRDLEIEIIDDVDDITFSETYKSETPIELYYREMSLVGKATPRNKSKEIEAKLNTIANGFHLINSIMSVCEDDVNHQKIYGVSDLNHPLRNKYQKTVHYSGMSEFMPKRLKSQIASLQNGKSFQELLGGKIRIATKEQRLNYIISAGINFNVVELGLDTTNQPLAVKRIPRTAWVGKMMKTLIDPLLGLMNNQILHYFACDYESDQLIIATPLCKWNIAQYIQLLRQSSVATMPGLTTIQIVKQFLDGLTVLHKCPIPIIHGNLKPSNIFIDFNGLVKIAEFGIHKALYKIIEAPKSSLIWFAKETLDIYRSSSIVECSIKSDICVAGMLFYFIVTCGKHPFGEDTDEILRNAHRWIPKLSVRNQDLLDLLLWMMFSDFNQRPCIEQVQSHPFFWSPAKKWSFVLSCAGVNQTEYVLPINIDKFYQSIDELCSAYITIEWHQVVANKYPNIRITESNTVVGFLKFIKNCHDRQLKNDSELSCMVLSLFPVLPVALYRTLQQTNWMKHPVFMPFTEVL